MKVSKNSLRHSGTVLLTVASVAVAGCSNTDNTADKLATPSVVHPGQVINLSYWNITLPQDKNNDGKPDQVKVKDIQAYTHPDYFYVNDNNEVVFTSPNVAVTTKNSKNARSELRHMMRSFDYSIKTKAPGNNFALASHKNAAAFAQIGGKLNATLHVDHVAVNSKRPDLYPTYSVVVGQIHAGKDKVPVDGFGYGNEPIKIYYKKFPDHKTGSVFWNYERNLAKEDPNRIDIAYPVWGYTWENPNDPADKGVALGENFSYEINVYEDTMYLTFTAEGKETVKYTINLADNVDANGNVDPYDHPKGYTGDWHYFKAGAYNQCNGGTKHPFWGTACGGTGVWAEDYPNGDYTQVTFSKIELSAGEKR